jgi:MFS family permease
VGPLIGGFINQYADWRWSFYVLIIWAGVQWLLILTLVPETYHPVLLRRKAIKLRAETGDLRYRAPHERLERSITMTVITSCYRPFQLLFLEPMCLLICLLSSVLLGILYLFFGAFPLVFGNNHGFQLWQVGLTFLGIFVGMMIGISSDMVWKKKYAKLVRDYSKETGIENSSEPEFRLLPTIYGAWIVPIALFGESLLGFPRTSAAVCCQQRHLKGNAQTAHCFWSNLRRQRH